MNGKSQNTDHEVGSWVVSKDFKEQIVRDECEIKNKEVSELNKSQQCEETDESCEYLFKTERGREIGPFEERCVEHGSEGEGEEDEEELDCEDL